MSTSPNKPKRARKDASSATTMSTSDGDNAFPESGGSKWKKRLHSLRRSLTRKRVSKFNEPRGMEDANYFQEFSSRNETHSNSVVADIRLDNGYLSASSNSCQVTNDRKISPSISNNSSGDVQVFNNTATRDRVKKKKGFSRFSKGDTVRGNKKQYTSQQELQVNGELTGSVNLLEKRDCDVKGKRDKFSRKNKSLVAFPSWFRTLGRSSVGKNLKKNRRGLSVSTGNFNEREHNFTLLTDVRLVRDPGYISSSADSLDRDDLFEEKYHSLRRSRASLIDIKWPKRGQSEGNLVSPTSSAFRTKSPSLRAVSRGPSSPTATKSSQPVGEVTPCDNNCDSGISKRDTVKERQTVTENIRKTGDRLPKSTRKSRCSASISEKSVLEKKSNQGESNHIKQNEGLTACGNLTEDEDVYLTAEEGSTSQSTSELFHASGDLHKILVDLASNDGKENVPSDNGCYQEQKACLLDPNISEKESISISMASLPAGTLTDTSENIKAIVQSNEQYSSIETHETPNSSSQLSKVPKSLSQSQPIRILPTCPMDAQDSSLHADKETNTIGPSKEKQLPDVCMNCCTKRSIQKNSPKLLSGQINELLDCQPQPSVNCPNCKSSSKPVSPAETCRDIVFTRPPRKPAPKPPALTKNKSKSLTTLPGKFSGLSEQIDLNESSSIHKLNDSCSENLCELLSKPKNCTSQSSEGVYVGILGEQGVILRKRRVLPKPNRVVSMPSELLENVVEVDRVEVPNLSSADGSISETSSDHAFTFQSSESESFLTCSSSTPSPANMHAVEKEVCMRSVSISSIEVQELSTRKKVVSQSVPCLAFNKECLNSLKSKADNQNIVHNDELSNQSLVLDRHEDCNSRKSSTAKSMMSLNCKGSYEDYGDVHEKVTGKPLMYAEALWDHVTMNEEELCFTAGQTIAVYDVDDPEWWFGLADDHIGWFPASFVRIPVSSDLLRKYQNSFGKNLAGVNGGNPSYNSDEDCGDVCLSNEEVRVKIIEEILNTEQDYVQNLKDIVERFPAQLIQNNGVFNIVTHIRDCSGRFVLEFLKSVRLRFTEYIPYFGTSFEVWKHHYKLREIMEKGLDRQLEAILPYPETMFAQHAMGYLKQAKKRPDMFSDVLLATIFSNIENIYKFHLEFLRCIQSQCDQDSQPMQYVGEVGKVFVENREKFSLYSEYCNNHPRATFELKNLLRQDKYRYFFEACRLLRDMIKISLDGFLLAPVQKICKYPLQLQELLKYTNPEHSDHANVKNALEVMREVASSINEKKRKVENIKKIAEWQFTIEQWEGEDVLIKSSQLVHSGEVLKISKGKTQDVTLFLFDHQLVYCRKDLIKKRSLEYKGRMVLENYKFEKLEDGEVSHNGLSVKNAWRLSSKHSNTICVFQTKTSDERDKWIKYFLQERKIVYESTSGNSIPLVERLAAMDAARNVVKNRKQIVKREKKYGNFNTVSRVIGELHYGARAQGHKVHLPPPVSSAMLFQRNELGRSSFGLLKSPGVFKKRRPKARRQSQTNFETEEQSGITHT